jgi:hypothetical protein
MLTQDELDQLLPAESSAFPSPIPTQCVSSDEYMPYRQTEKQHGVGRTNRRYGYVAKPVA